MTDLRHPVGAGRQGAIGTVVWLVGVGGEVVAGPTNGPMTPASPFLLTLVPGWADRVDGRSGPPPTGLGEAVQPEGDQTEGDHCEQPGSDWSVTQGT